MDDIEDFRRFDRVAAQISKLGNVDATLDRTTPVFIPADNFESYVLLTKQNVDKWTRAIVSFLTYSGPSETEFDRSCFYFCSMIA